MTAIVCVDKNWAIGRDNALLFHIRLGWLLLE